MSHTAKVNLIANQCIEIFGNWVNIHDIETIEIDAYGNICAVSMPTISEEEAREDNMDKILEKVEENLNELASQYKSGQHVLIIDALKYIEEAKEEAGRLNDALSKYTALDKPVLDYEDF